MGRSLGGAVAAYMVEQDEGLFRGLILENCFASIERMATVMFPFIEPVLPWILKIGWYTDRIVPKLRLPVFYVTGDQDEIVPFTQTLDLDSLTTNTVFKDLYIVKDGTHNDSWYVGGVDYLKRLQKFMKKCIIQYRQPEFDEWATGSKSDMLEQETEEASKVKITRTVLPPGALDKIKKDAARQKMGKAG